MDRTSGGSVARTSEVLDAARGRGFVGRDQEVAAVRRSLEGRSPARVHLVHGPGGIGKSTLLDALAREARALDRSAVYLDARELEGTAESVLAALRAQAVGDDPDLLLVDGYELLAPIDRWFRDVLLPSRPAGAVTVLAGREAPAAEWWLDPGWRQLATVHELVGLTDEEALTLLDRLGVSGPAGATVTRLGRGFPLALAMLAEAVAEGAEPDVLAQAPGVVEALCARIVDDVPDEACRTGLATCAHACRMTQDLLTHIVGRRAPEVWAWLESRPYVRRGEVGLFLHDVVREAFEAEFAQRAPEAYADLHTSVRWYFVGLLLDPATSRPDRAAAELLLMHRAGPLASQTALLRDAGVLAVRRAEDEDMSQVLSLIEHGESPRSAALAQQYLATQPEGLSVVRSDEGVAAFAMHVYLPTGDALDSDDPVAAAVLAAVAEHGPLRPGERINVNRFGGGADPYQGSPAQLLANGICCILEWLRQPAAWTFIAATGDEFYGRYFEYLGLRRMVEVDDDGLRTVCYGWDRRRFPLPAFLELMARRELTGETGPPPADLLRPAPLGEEEFAREVKAALAVFPFPDQLAQCRLADSALTAQGPPLAAVLPAALDALADEPGGEAYRRVLERTYLKGSPSQEAAAEVLGLPFSTYRRHLAKALDRFTAVLWSVEVGERILPLPPPPTDSE